jgi:hypothetical protein
MRRDTHKTRCIARTRSNESTRRDIVRKYVLGGRLAFRVHTVLHRM